MRSVLVTAVACLGALPAAAEDLDPRWSRIGEARVTVAGETHVLAVLDDAEDDRDFVEATDADAFRVLTLTASAVEDGAPSAPRLTLTFGPFSDGGLPDRAAVLFETAEATFAGNADTGGKLAVMEMATTESGETRFAFGGLVVPVELIPGGALAPVEAAQGVPIEGRFSAILPES